MQIVITKNGTRHFVVRAQDQTYSEPPGHEVVFRIFGGKPEDMEESARKNAASRGIMSIYWFGTEKLFLDVKA